MGQDKFRRKSGGVQATQYDPRGSTAIVYRNTVQCSPKFTAIIVATGHETPRGQDPCWAPFYNSFIIVNFDRFILK